MGSSVSKAWGSFQALTATRKVQILLVGLDNSGKSTICDCLRVGTAGVSTLPTIGADVREVRYKNIKFTVFDVGGSEASQGFGRHRDRSGNGSGHRHHHHHRHRQRDFADSTDDLDDEETNADDSVHRSFGEYGPIWEAYYTNTDAIIFVVDSTDQARLHDGPGCVRHNACTALHLLLEDVSLAHCAVLVLANKQDCDDALSVAEVADALKLRQLRTGCWFIQGCCALSGDGVWEGLDWLAKQLLRKINER